MPNGAGAAAILAGGVGMFAVGVLAIAADKFALLGKLLVFYPPTGRLSGVTCTAILIWLLSWAILEWRWRKRNVALGRINLAAFVLLGLSLLLTFPPIAELF
jgi:hypothetical protein